MLSLDALAHWEAAVLASIRGAGGTPDERDAQITRSGMYAEYPAIVASYLELTGAAYPAMRVEALKRAVFLVWHSFNSLPVETGIAELPESDVRRVMEALDTAIAAGLADEELRAMLAWYRDSFGYPFDHFGPVRALDGFIRDLTSDEARERLRASTFTDRGQLGAYWSTVLGA